MTPRAVLLPPPPVLSGCTPQTLPSTLWPGGRGRGGASLGSILRSAPTHWMFSNRHLTTAQGMTKNTGAPAGRAQLRSGGPRPPAPHRARRLTPADGHVEGEAAPLREGGEAQQAVQVHALHQQPAVVGHDAILHEHGGHPAAGHRLPQGQRELSSHGRPPPWGRGPEARGGCSPRHSARRSC